MDDEPKLSPEVFQVLEAQAQNLTHQLGGRLRAWKIYGPCSWPIVLVLSVEASEEVCASLGRYLETFGVLTVKFMHNGEVKYVKYRRNGKYLPDAVLEAQVLFNFIEVQKSDGRFNPKW